MTEPKIVVFSGSTTEPLTQSVCQSLGIAPGKRALLRHNDGTPGVQLLEKVRGDIAVMVQSLCPMDRAWAELMAMADAARRASAAEIWAVLPYFAGRQDKGDAPRVDITASWSLRLLEAQGVSRLLSFDLHSGQIRGFVSIPFDHLTVLPMLLQHLVKERAIDVNRATLVSPDAGGVKRVRNLAHRFKAGGMVIIDKEREAPGQNRVVSVIGNPGKTAIIVDDIADTCGTLCEAAEALKAKGAEHVYAVVTHAVLGGRAVENLSATSALEYLVVSDTITLSKEALATGKIGVVSVAGVIADALRRMRTGSSLQEMAEFAVGHVV